MLIGTLVTVRPRMVTSQTQTVWPGLKGSPLKRSWPHFFLPIETNSDPGATNFPLVKVLLRPALQGSPPIDQTHLTLLGEGRAAFSLL